jgi:glycosyltransferase involved in cell wall biosynthesis
MTGPAGGESAPDSRPTFDHEAVAPVAGLEFSESSRLSLAERGGPIKIAIIGSRGFPSTYGGYETLVRHIARTWAADGHEVTVYCRSRLAGSRNRTWTVDGVRCIWTPGRDTKSASTLTYGLTSHIDASPRHFDAALVLNVANGYFLPLLRAAGVGSVLNTDGLEWKRGKWGSAARKIFYKGAQLSARHADVLVSDSLAIADVWDGEFGVRPTYIPYGADAQRDLPDDRVAELGLQPRAYALVVARLIPENNVDLALDALERTTESRPAVIVGSANYESATEDRLRALHDAGSVRWLGHVHDHSGVYIHGHSVGGTNPALLQAMGAGAPVLALDTPFNREVIPHDEQLYPAHAGTLAERIDAILSDEALRQSWISRGLTRIQERFRWQAVCDAYETALREAARRRASRKTTA